MSSSQRRDASLYEQYVQEVYREANLRKNPDTVLIERIRQKYTVMSEANDLGKRLDEIFKSNTDINSADTRKLLETYRKKITEFQTVFTKEQKELDGIKSILREIPTIIVSLESTIKHLPKSVESPDNSKKGISDQVMTKMTLTALKHMHKDMKQLATQRYKIDISPKDANVIHKQIEKIKIQYDKLMKAFEHKVEKFYDALSLAYKSARAKARAKSSARTKQKIKKAKATAKSKAKAAASKSAKKNKSSTPPVNIRNSVSDYIQFFRERLKADETRYINITHKYTLLMPKLVTTAVIKPTNNHEKFNNRVLANYPQAKNLLDKIKQLKDQFNSIKKEGESLTTQSDARTIQDIQDSISAKAEVNAKAVLDDASHAIALRTAILAAVVEYGKTQRMNVDAMYTTLKTSFPSDAKISEVIKMINVTLANHVVTYDDKFIQLLKQNLASAMRNIPYRFADQEHDTDQILFAVDRAYDLTNSAAVSSELEQRSLIVNKAAVILDQYEESFTELQSIYKREAKVAAAIFATQAKIEKQFSAVKIDAQNYLRHTEVNQLLADITAKLKRFDQPTITLAVVETYASDIAKAMSDLKKIITQAAVADIHHHLDAKFEIMKDRTINYLHDNDINKLLGNITLELHHLQEGKMNHSAASKIAEKVEAYYDTLNDAILRHENNLEAIHYKLYEAVKAAIVSQPELDSKDSLLQSELDRQALKSMYSTDNDRVDYSENILALATLSKELLPKKHLKFFDKAVSEPAQQDMELIAGLARITKATLKEPYKLNIILNDIKKLYPATRTPRSSFDKS